MTEIEEKIRQVLQEKNTKILPANIKSGVEIFDVTGSYTSDGDVTAYDVAQGKIAYANGSKITGNLQEVAENSTTSYGATFTEIEDDPTNNKFVVVTNNTSERILRDNVTQRINVDYSAQGVVQNLNALGIKSDNILAGKTILGVNGNVIKLVGQTKTVNPSTSSQTIEPDNGYNAITEVNVEAVDNTIDNNIKAENIKSGVTILGVQGNVTELNAQTKSVSPTTSQQVITPDGNYNALSSVTIGAVDSSIDSNIMSSNIKSGVTILGVQGNIEPDKPDQSKTVTPTTSQQVVEADIGYELSSVIVDAIETEQKTVKSTTSSQTITPTSGKFIDEITVDPIVLETTNVTPTTSSQTITPTIGNDGLESVTIDAIQTEHKTVKSATSSQTITPTSGKFIDEITVDPIDLESKTATPTTSQQIITPSSGKDGLDSVTIGAVDNTIDNNIISGNIKSGVTILGVSGKSSVVDTDDADAVANNIKSGKTAYVNGTKITGTLPVKTYPENPSDPTDWDYQFVNVNSKNNVYTYNRDNVDYLVGRYQIGTNDEPDWMMEGNSKMKLGISYSAVANSLRIRANVIKSGVTIAGVTGNVVELNGEARTATPTTSQQILTPSSGKNGMTQVTIDAVDNTIDNNIVPGNIKSGVSILGVNGSVVELQGETKTVTPTTSQQTITPSSGKNGITEVTINAVDETIDSNIIASNIKSGISILGVNGSVVELNGETKTLTPTTSQQTITPSIGKNAITQVTLEAVDNTIDNNIIAGNIKDGVTILGVTGNVIGTSTTTQRLLYLPKLNMVYDGTTTDKYTYSYGDFYYFPMIASNNRQNYYYIVLHDKVNDSYELWFQIGTNKNSYGYLSSCTETSTFECIKNRLWSIYDLNDANNNTTNLNLPIQGNITSNFIENLRGYTWVIRSTSGYQQISIPFANLSNYDIYTNLGVEYYYESSDLAVPTLSSYTDFTQISSATSYITPENELANGTLLTKTAGNYVTGTPEYLTTTFDEYFAVKVSSDVLLKGNSYVVPGTKSNVANFLGVTSANLVSGATILGVSGDSSNVNTSDANATSSDILLNKTAYVNGTKITGTLPSYEYPTYSSDNQIFAESTTNYLATRDSTNYVVFDKIISSSADPSRFAVLGNKDMKVGCSYSNLASLIGINSSKLLSGQTVLGVTGSSSNVNTSDANAVADNILTGKTAYVNGTKITGTALGITSNYNMDYLHIPKMCNNDNYITIDYIHPYGYLPLSASMFNDSNEGSEVRYYFPMNGIVVVDNVNGTVQLYVSYSSTLDFEFDGDYITIKRDTTEQYLAIYTLKESDGVTNVIPKSLTQNDLSSNEVEKIHTYMWIKTYEEDWNSSTIATFTYGITDVEDTTGYEFYSFMAFTNADENYTDFASYSTSGLLKGYQVIDAFGNITQGTTKSFGSGTFNTPTIQLDTSNSMLKYKVKSGGAGNYRLNAGLQASFSDVASAIGLTSSKLVSGNTVLGISGSSANVNTSDANAVSTDIANGKTAYVNGSKVTGGATIYTYPTKSGDYNYSFLPSTLGAYTYTKDGISYLVGQEWVAQSTDPECFIVQSNRKMKVGIPFNQVTYALSINASKIKKGATIAGVAGTYTSDATATASDIASGKTAYVNGTKITGSAASVKQEEKLAYICANNLLEYNDKTYNVLSNKVKTYGIKDYNAHTITWEPNVDYYIGLDAANVKVNLLNVAYPPSSGIPDWYNGNLSPYVEYVNHMTSLNDIYSIPNSSTIEIVQSNYKITFSIYGDNNAKIDSVELSILNTSTNSTEFNSFTYIKYHDASSPVSFSGDIDGAATNIFKMFLTTPITSIKVSSTGLTSSSNVSDIISIVIDGINSIIRMYDDSIISQ